MGIRTTPLLHTQEYRGDHSAEITLPMSVPNEVMQALVDAACELHPDGKLRRGDKIVIYTAQAKQDGAPR